MLVLTHLYNITSKTGMQFWDFKVYEMKFLCQMLSKVIACCVLAEIENVTIKYTEDAKSESILNVK